MSCSIYQLNSQRCRWPLGKTNDRPPYDYCGEQTITGSPYCLEHACRAYTKCRTPTPLDGILEEKHREHQRQHKRETRRDRRHDRPSGAAA